MSVMPDFFSSAAIWMLELVGHPVELGDHHVELQHLPALLVHLKPLQPNEIFT